MARSTGISTRQSRHAMSRLIRQRAQSVTINRPVRMTNALDDTDETIDEHTESMWLFDARESIADEIGGDRINGGLGGLVVAGRAVDLDKDDRITHGGVEYEIDTIVGQPVDDDPDGTCSPETTFYIVNFVRRHQ